jgi:hypothetical protein
VTTAFATASKNCAALVASIATSTVRSATKLVEKRPSPANSPD